MCTLHIYVMEPAEEGIARVEQGKRVEVGDHLLFNSDNGLCAC